MFGLLTTADPGLSEGFTKFDIWYTGWIGENIRNLPISGNDHENQSWKLLRNQLKKYSTNNLDHSGVEQNIGSGFVIRTHHTSQSLASVVLPSIVSMFMVFPSKSLYIE